MLCWPSDDLPNQVAFVSDLHLFSTRSTAQRHLQPMLEAARSAEVIVFGGDLFDFRWSRVGDSRRTTEAGIDWLARFMKLAGQREYVYLFGNHDGEPELRGQLTAWSRDHDNFHVAGDLMRLGDIAMLHGDAVEGNGDVALFDAYRTRWANKPQATMTQSRAYDAAVTVGAHRLAAALAHRRRRTFMRLLQYLNHHECGTEHGIRRVVFGHTHRYVPGVSYGGVHFYNPGATVRGVPFQPVVLSTERQ